MSEIKLNKDKSGLEWSNGSTVNLKSGELKGLLELYSGNGTDNSYRGIPYYQRKLDEFAKGGFAEGGLTISIKKDMG